jgi:putative zinc finger protein
MTKRDHLTSALLVKAMDAELTSGEVASVMEHLAQCEGCRDKYESFRCVSLAIESGVATGALGDPLSERENLRQKLEARQTAQRPGQTPDRVLWRFGWGMAIAASLAIGIVMAPRNKNTADKQQGVHAASFASSIEVGGESFVPLPYSNPDLPVNESRIVEMQVPVSALNDIGIVLESVSNRESAPDRSVLADVLMGTDGQPLGVHVLE